MRSPPSRAENQLPRYLTSFVGREDDIVEITGLLMREDVRLLTMVGPGGAGKTRLAIEAVARFDQDAWDDVLFVPLVAVRDPALVLPAVAQALGLQRVAGRPVEEAIIHVLRDKRTLLVVDNFEHVTEAAPALGRILAACPESTILATSRVALRISGEHLFVVQPLKTPDDSVPAPDVLVRFESIQLFLERADASGRPIVLGDENAADIAEICRRLDGLPLALELAAARSSLLSPSALRSLLDSGAGILSGGPHDAPDRHRSMHEAIAWSYNLLPDDEQTIFRRLAVFSGGFSLEAAEAVVDLPVNVWDAIASLATKSLLIPVSVETGEPRFTMLETIREFGQEQLTKSGESRSTRDRHAAWFSNVAEESDYAWCMPLEDGLARIHRLHVEQGNVRAALQWLHGSGKVAACLTMASKLGTLWVVLGNSAEGQRWLETLLAMPGLDNPRDRAKALAILSWIANQHGDNMNAFELAEEGISIYRTYDDPLGVIQCLVLSGVAASRIPHFTDAAIRRHREAIAHMEALRDPPWIVNWIVGELQQLGQMALLDGDLDRATSIFGEAWAHLEEKGARFLYGSGLLLWTAHLARVRGDDASALQTYQQTLELAHRGVPHQGLRRGHRRGRRRVGRVRTGRGLSPDVRCRRSAPRDVRYSLHRRNVRPPTRALPSGTLGSGPGAIRCSTTTPRCSQGYRHAHPTGHTGCLQACISVGRGARDYLRDSGTRGTCGDARERAEGEHHVQPERSLRELEVLRLVAEGHSNRAIADALSISERTVEHHVAHILTKLDLDSRTAAATFAVRNGLL